MNTKKITRGTPVTDMDDFKDLIIQNCNDSLLMEVLIEVYKGQVFRYTADIDSIIEENSCACENIICEALIESIHNWAKESLQLKMKSNIFYLPIISREDYADDLLHSEANNLEEHLQLGGFLRDSLLRI